MTFDDRNEVERTIACVECDGKIAEGDAERRGWSYWSDGLGELHPFFPECAEREFRHVSRFRDRE